MEYCDTCGKEIRNNEEFVRIIEQVNQSDYKRFENEIIYEDITELDERIIKIECMNCNKKRRWIK